MVFLEELYPAYGNLVPRDIAAREILRICEMGLGVEGQDQVFLDVTELSHHAQKKLRAILDTYEKFTGQDPRQVPMKIFPAVHYTMGGAWVDWPACEDKDRESRFRQMTNIPGLFNVGESDYLYHGANRLGANALLSCIFGGLTTAQEVVRYIEKLPRLAQDIPHTHYQSALDQEKAELEILRARSGNENIFELHDELAEWMVNFVTVNRNNRHLEQTIHKILELKERMHKAPINDTSRFVNQSLIFSSQFGPMLEIALLIAQGAYLRNESRGAHFKTDFPHRNDKEWLKTTLAKYTGKNTLPHFWWVPVDIRYVDPIHRDYTKAEKTTPHFKNLPSNIPLPV